MPLTPSLRHCSNKYKLAREGEKDKEKDEDLERFFFMMIDIFMMIFLWLLIYDDVMMNFIYFLLKKKVPHFKTPIYVMTHCVEYSITKTIHKALSMHIKGFYLSSVMYRKKLLRRTRRDISVLQPEGRRLLCPLWWGARTLSKSAPHTFLCHMAAIPQMPW